MNGLWNKDGVNRYDIDINHVRVTIFSHNQNLHFANYPKKEIKSRLVIWFEESVSSPCKDMFKVVDANEAYILPKPICDAYNYLNLPPNSMKQHINHYCEFGDYIFSHFRFPSDDFYLAYHRYINELFLWGNQANLERILISVLSMTGDVLPFHSALLEYQGNGYMIIGDSGSGKTSIAMMLLKKGASYIADDILYMDRDGNGYRCGDYMSLRNEYLTKELSRYTEFEKGDKAFINVKSMCKENEWGLKDSVRINRIILISPLQPSNITCTKLFCTFRHDSMIGLEFLHDTSKSIASILNESMKKWCWLYSSVRVDEMIIDYNNFISSTSSELERLII